MTKTAAKRLRASLIEKARRYRALAADEFASQKEEIDQFGDTCADQATPIAYAAKAAAYTEAANMIAAESK